MDKPVFKLINKAWISLLGPVDTEKFKNEFLIQNNYEINLNPEFSNFSNFEGVKKFQAFVNENPRDASLHIMISQAGFCLIILTFSITYEEFTKFDVIKIKTDEVVQGKPTAEFFFDIAEQIFDVQSRNKFKYNLRRNINTIL